ncbi:hypothetical protein [uncultured Ruegeria sp.]|uniref:hypothetical protein n=1 Tax=uncultured Ruegeria sp. TaxID=259304 RepID=UPI00262CE759|nr:hypothetical protein [uncultured Ruegeria sp.]
MTIHRRTLMKSSLPVLGAAIATGALASGMLDSATETPIQILYREWVDLGNRYGNAIDENNALEVRLEAEGNEDASGLTENHYSKCVEPLCLEFAALENKLMDIPSQDFKDLAIKARISARVDGVIDDEFNRLIRRDADRLLGHVNI